MTPGDKRGGGGEPSGDPHGLDEAPTPPNCGVPPSSLGSPEQRTSFGLNPCVFGQHEHFSGVGFMPECCRRPFKPPQILAGFTCTQTPPSTPKLPLTLPRGFLTPPSPQGHPTKLQPGENHWSNSTICRIWPQSPVFTWSLPKIGPHPHATTGFWGHRCVPYPGRPPRR